MKDEGTTTLPEVHRRDETDRAKVHHLRPVQSGADLRSVPVEGGRDGMRRDHLPLDPGRRSAGAMTIWLVTSGMAGDVNEDETASTDPEWSSWTELTYR